MTLTVAGRAVTPGALVGSSGGQRTARPTWWQCLDYVSQCSQAQWTHSPDFRGFSCVFLGMTVKEDVGND